MSAPRSTPSAAEHGRTRRGSTGLTPRECEVVVRLQRGDTIPAVAADLGISERSARRLRASAVKHGAILTPPSAQAPAQADDGRFIPEPKPKGRVPFIAVTGGPETSYERQRSEEDHAARQLRTGGDGQMTRTDRDAQLGDLDSRGRVLVGQSIGLAPARSALDAWTEHRPPDGATAAIIEYEDGTIRRVQL